jgi:hypothetical protein
VALQVRLLSPQLSSKLDPGIEQQALTCRYPQGLSHHLHCRLDYPSIPSLIPHSPVVPQQLRRMQQQALLPDLAIQPWIRCPSRRNYPRLLTRPFWTICPRNELVIPCRNPRPHQNGHGIRELAVNAMSEIVLDAGKLSCAAIPVEIVVKQVRISPVLGEIPSFRKFVVPKRNGLNKLIYIYSLFIFTYASVLLYRDDNHFPTLPCPRPASQHPTFHIRIPGGELFVCASHQLRRAPSFLSSPWATTLSAAANANSAAAPSNRTTPPLAF